MHKFNESSKLHIYPLYSQLVSRSFGRVLLVKENGGRDYWACKIVGKKRVIETKQVEHTLNEKNILWCMESSFVVDLTEFFQDSKNLYFILEFAPGGEMFTIIQKQRRRRFTSEQVGLLISIFMLTSYLHLDEFALFNFRLTETGHAIVEYNATYS